MTPLRDVNTTDILDAIRLGCQTMQNVFNRDDDHVPFFRSTLRPKAELGFSPHHSESHVPGRHLNALLEAEAAAGVLLDEAAVAHHRRAALFSFSGPLALPLNRQAIGGRLQNFCPHNLREGFHALYALTRFRADAQAQAMAERTIATVNDYWRPDQGPDQGWDLARLEGHGLTIQPCQGFLHGEGRMLGPLVKYAAATGSGPALALALRMREKAVTDFFLADGAYDPARFITRHSHSITCLLSSLAQLADLLGDASLLARVKAFYDNGLWQMRDAIGWSPEAVGQQDSDHGEANNTGDILETALILGKWGYPAAYHDAERILRCHLLPSQLRDVSFVDEPPNPAALDGLRDLARRHRGAYGMPAPYGHQSIGAGRGSLCFNMDIVGGTVGSLCAAYRAVVEERPTGHWVNLLFDHLSRGIRVESPYTHDALLIELAETGPLFVRIPPWVDRSAIRIEGSSAPPLRTNDTLFFAAQPAGQPLRVHFPLEPSEITLPAALHIHPIQVKLQGDSVAAMENFGADLTFFDPYG